MTTLAETITAIIAEKAMLDPSEVRADMTLQSLGMDSLALVEAIFSIEETFDIQIPFQNGDAAEGGFDLASVASIIHAVEGIVAQKAA